MIKESTAQTYVLTWLQLCGLTQKVTLSWLLYTLARGDWCCLCPLNTFALTSLHFCFHFRNNFLQISLGLSWQAQYRLSAKRFLTLVAL